MSDEGDQFDATAPENSSYVPSWHVFCGMHLLWPCVVQICVVVLFTLCRAIADYADTRSRGATGDAKDGSATIAATTQTRPSPTSKHQSPGCFRTLASAVASDRVVIAMHMVQIGLSLGEVFLYAIHSGVPDNMPTDQHYVWDIGFSVVFMIIYALERLGAGCTPSNACTQDALVDVLTIVPVLCPFGADLQKVPLMQRWLSLKFLRISRVANSYLYLDATIHLEQVSDLFQGLVCTIIRTLALLVVMGGIVFTLEVLGELPNLKPTTVLTEMGDLNFCMMVYWMVTTISTVGYGDYAPKTVPSRFVICVFIFIGVLFFGKETDKLLKLNWSVAAGRGRYAVGIKKKRHLVITGTGVSSLSATMESFLCEVLSVSEVDAPNIVLLSEAEYDEKVVNFVKDRKINENVWLLRGSARSPDDLARVQMGRCDMAFVVPTVGSADRMLDDRTNTLIALEIGRMYPDVALRLMLLEAKSKELAVCMGFPSPCCFAAEALQVNMLAQSTRVKGMQTLVSGLIMATIPEQATLCSPIYAESIMKSFYGFAAGGALQGLSFSEAAKRVYTETKGNMILVAAQVKGSLRLNWQGAISDGQILMAIASCNRDCMKFSKEGARWRELFTSRRRVASNTESGEFRFDHTCAKPDMVEATVNEQTVDLAEVMPASDRKSEKKNAAGVALDDIMAEMNSSLPTGFRQRKGSEQYRTLLESDGLVLVIVMKSCETGWATLRSFLCSLRKEHLPVQQSCVVLSPEKAPEELKNAFPGHYAWVTGPLFDLGTLTYAGAPQASSVVVLRGRSESGQCYQIDMPDYEVSTMALLLSRVPRKRDRHDVFELASTDAIELLEAHHKASALSSYSLGTEAPPLVTSPSSEMQGRVSTTSRLSTQSKSSGRFSAVTSLLRLAKTDILGEVSSRRLLQLDSFAAGQSFSPDFFGGYLGRMFDFPAIIELTEAMCNPESSNQTSYVWQVRCPEAWVGRTFGELTTACAAGGPGSILPDVGPVIVLALFRCQRGAIDTPYMGISLTLPQHETSLEASDLVTVLGAIGLGRAAAQAKLLRGTEEAGLARSSGSGSSIRVHANEEAAAKSL